MLLKKSIDSDTRYQTGLIQWTAKFFSGIRIFAIARFFDRRSLRSDLRLANERRSGNARLHTRVFDFQQDIIPRSPSTRTTWK